MADQASEIGPEGLRGEPRLPAAPGRGLAALGSAFLYRENALRLRISPLQLEAPVRIAGIWSWLFLSALLLALGAAVSWGLFGTVPTRVAGQGLLVSDASAIRAITTATGGNVVVILVRPGDRVTRGQRIAVLDQPELSQQLQGINTMLTLLQKQRDEVVDFYKQFLTEYRRAAQVRHDNLAATLRVMDQRIESQQRIVDNFRLLEKQGLATALQVADADEKLRALQVQQHDTASELARSEVDSLNSLNARDTAVRDYDAKIADAVRERAQIQAELDRGGVVVSPATGVIATVDAQPNTRLAAGGLLAALAEGEGTMEAILFVSAADGKLIEPGMRASVLPAMLKPEESGAIIGQVTEVGIAPESRSSMMRLLSNEVAVAQFAASGLPLTVRIKLNHDPAGPGGLQWSSGRPADDTQLAGILSIGTLVYANVAVREQPPITLVLPTLKRWFGLHP